jgi:hypothetical protein
MATSGTGATLRIAGRETGVDASRLIRALAVAIAVFGFAALTPAKSFAIGPCNPSVQVCS